MGDRDLHVPWQKEFCGAFEFRVYAQVVNYLGNIPPIFGRK